MFNGVINIYKEQGYTSFDVVAKLRGILKQKKIGHTGTLDPMAEGVLIVCLGKATKLVDMLTVHDKCYKAVMKLGLETDTEDITGKVISAKGYDNSFSKEYIIETINSFIGSYEQIPPMYSAIKKDGKKLYEYAREGKIIERTPRLVEIFEITDITIDKDEVSFCVRCSKGTYIRSLCRDIGEKLGCGATLKQLVRTVVHGNTIDNSLKLNEVQSLVNEDKIKEVIEPLDSLLQEYDAYYIEQSYKKYLMNGNILFENQIKAFDSCTNSFSDGQIIRVYLNDEFLALYKYVSKEKVLKPYKMFL
ncbi:MAG: tRNA pseudouridine(55) synthase TruB [Lachnospiraceae bacterium]|nr:tRNA pseudouridine(55) synthase TruB [Lachnospiraceae bacterium]